METRSSRLTFLSFEMACGADGLMRRISIMRGSRWLDRDFLSLNETPS